MEVTKTLSGRIYPNKKQIELINYNLDCCRFVKNKMIERHKKIYERRKETITLYDMQKLVTEMKIYLPWLKQADSRALAYACREVQYAYNLFFKKVSNYPKFHSKKGKQSYTTTYIPKNNVQKNKVCLPKIGWIKVRGFKELPANSEICYITIIREVDNVYHVCLTYKYKINNQKQKEIISENDILGLDYKSNGFYVDNNGNTPSFNHWFRDNQTKLAKQQRKLDRKVGSKKGEKKSSNWYKQYRRVIKIQRKIVNKRKDALHKLSTELSENYYTIGVEDINLLSMAMNKKMNLGKSTMDNGFGMFRIMLDHKLKERGKLGIIKIDKYFPSSQICNCCGFQNSLIKDLSIREWICPNCGEKHDRDINAAKNIQLETINILKANNQF